MLAPHLPYSSPLLRLSQAGSSSAHFGFVLTVITITILFKIKLFSVLPNISATVFTHACKVQSKQDVGTGSSWNGTGLGPQDW